MSNSTTHSATPTSPTDQQAVTPEAAVAAPVTGGPSGLRRILRMLVADKLALLSALFLVIVILCAILGPLFLAEMASDTNLRARNAPRSSWSAALPTSSAEMPWAGRCWPGSSWRRAIQC